MMMRPEVDDVRPTSTDPTVDPPAGYPAAAWIDDPAAPFYVPAELRDDYAKAPASVETYAAAKPATYERRDDGELSPAPVAYTTWAHRTRMRRARQIAGMRQRQAEYDAAYLRLCPSCAVASDSKLWKRVERPAVLAGLAAFPVCPACLPVVESALLAAQRLPDGRTRGDAAAELAARLTGELVSS
jgi:hypothetical protein